MEHVKKKWVCNPDRYPALAGMNAEERRNFLVKHSLLHITKTAGKLAAICENFDHESKNAPEDEENLKIGVIKLFVNALKLAEEVGLTAEDLLNKAPEYVK